MSLRFILGRAGSGKTHTCLTEIREELLQAPEGSPLIIIVPEQATFQIEKELTTACGIDGMMRAQVLSFRRLAHRIMLEVGGAARPLLGDLGKRMIIRNIIEKRKENLKVFARAAKQPGFADTLASTLSEFKIYGIGTDELQRTLEVLASADAKDEEIQLINKLQDLNLLYQDLETYLANKFIDPDDYLRFLAEGASKAESIKEARVWVDSFSGFNPQEYKVLESILLTAKQVNISLCLDVVGLDKKAQAEDLFFTTRETMDKLTKLAKDLYIPIEKHVPLDNESLPRYLNNPAVAHLEKYFYSRPAPAFMETAEITLVSAANKRVEVEGVAREITRLCRDEGYRWQDISVILRNASDYSAYIETIFSDHGIPFFIDVKQAVTHHPLVELLQSALEVVESNWAYEPVFRFFKTDFAPLSRQESDVLENYVLAHGIRGSRWTDGSTWTYRRHYTLGEDGEAGDVERSYLEGINSAKDKGAFELIKFYKALKTTKEQNVKEICITLYSLLEELEVERTLQQWTERSISEGNIQQSRIHAQVWADFAGLLDEIVEALGETSLTLKEFHKVLNTGLEGMRMGLIPPALDQVLIASLERSRNPNVHAAFVLGVNDGILPQRQSESGLLNDSERLFLTHAGLELAPDKKRRLLNEQFLVYIALTRASVKLWLSHTLANSEGGAMMPSSIIARIKELVPAVKERNLPVEPSFEDGEEYITNPGRALTYLSAQLRSYKATLAQGQNNKLNPLWWDIYNYSLDTLELKDRLALQTSGLFHSNNEEPIETKLSQKLYSRVIKGSVSRLEKFSACPFKHFLAHGLKLKERAQFRLAAPDLGQFFHAALKLVSDDIQAQNLDWATLDRAMITQLTQTAVTTLTPQLQNEILLSSERLRYLTKKLQRIIERTLRTLVEHARRGQFRPVALELGFGNNAELPALNFTLQDGTVLEMSGRIDRIDRAGFGDEVYLRIVDYKSGKSKLALLDILTGSKLQLLTYLHVALNNAKTLLGSEAKPAAMLYMPVSDPVIALDKPLTQQEIEEAIIKDMKTNGLLLKDTSIVKLMDNTLDKGSSIIPAGIKKDGEFIASSAVLTMQQFGKLREYLEHILKSFGERISAGEVAIDPYQQKKFRTCQYCSFKEVCHFDNLLPDNKYRTITVLNDDQVFLKIDEVLKGGDKHE